LPGTFARAWEINSDSMDSVALQNLYCSNVQPGLDGESGSMKEESRNVGA
jgi:hypothetical protein